MLVTTLLVLFIQYYPSLGSNHKIHRGVRKALSLKPISAPLRIFLNTKRTQIIRNDLQD